MRACLRCLITLVGTDALILYVPAAVVIMHGVDVLQLVVVLLQLLP